MGRGGRTYSCAQQIQLWRSIESGLSEDRAEENGMIILKRMLEKICLDNMISIFLDFRSSGTLRRVAW